MCPKDGSGWDYRCWLGSLGNSSTDSENSTLRETVGRCYNYLSGLFSSLLTFFLCFYVLLHSCCSLAQVLWETLVHEFHISYCHNEWNVFSSLSKNGKKIWKQSAVKLNITKNADIYYKPAKMLFHQISKRDDSRWHKRAECPDVSLADIHLGGSLQVNSRCFLLTAYADQATVTVMEHLTHRYTVHS